MLKATAIGNVGNDPELRYSASRSPFLRFNVASNYRTREAGGEWQDRTEWVRCTVFGPRAESLGQYLRKGTRVYVSGRLEARPWTDREGQVRAGLEIMAEDVEFFNQRGPDFDTDDLPAPASVADERRDRRRMPESVAVAGARAGTAVADRAAELEDLPF